MLTNNKKSYFVKGIAMLMAMLMVLSVCLTGCGKKAEEAIQKAEAAQGSADEAKTAADAVKAMLADYLKAADGATKAEIEALIDDALADFETAKELSSFVKSDKFDELKTKVDSLLTADAVNAAINTLKDSKADKSELTAIDNALQALIAAKADIATTATKAEVEALEDALTKMIDAKQTAINGILSTLEGKASNDALAEAKKDLINLIDANAADITETLKSYVKADEYATLKAAVEKNTADMADALDNLSADVRALVEGMTSVKGDVNDLKGKVTALEDGMTEAWKSINEISANVPGLLVDLNALTTKVAGMEDSLDLLSADVRNLTVGLSDLKGKVAALEAVDLDKTITDALAAYATKGQVAEYVYTILKDFYDTDENGNFIGVDKDGKEYEIKIDMATMSAEMIAGLLKNSPLWSEVEWNLTTPVVIEAIDGLQTLLDKLYDIDSVYTSDNKIKINDLLADWGIVIFNNDGSIRARDGVEELLLYTLLRTPNRKNLNALNTAVDKANEIETFLDEWNAHLNTLRFGHEMEDAAGNVYYVVTYNPEQVELFNIFSDKLDKIVAKYVRDNAFEGHTVNPDKTPNTWYSDLNDLTAYYVDANGYFTKNAENARPTLYEYTEDALKNPVKLDAVRTEKLGELTLVKLPACIPTMNWTVADTQAVKLVGYAVTDEEHYTTEVAVGDANASVYHAYYKQFRNSLATINEARDAFETFYTETIWKTDRDLKGKTSVTNEELLEALTIYMAVEGWDSGDGITFEYDYYLDTDVTPYMNKALAFNNCGTKDHNDYAHKALNAFGTYKGEEGMYDLYVRMTAKNWMLKFEKYSGAATQVLGQMYNDYVQVSVNALLTDGAQFDAAGKLVINDAVLAETTKGFMDAFLNGGDFAGWSYGNVSYEIAKEHSYKTNNLLYFYGENNGVAGTDYKADPMASMVNYIKTYNPNLNVIQLDLMGAVNPTRQALDAYIAGILEAGEAPSNVDTTKDPVYLFTEYFDAAFDALNEVYERYLLNDYKKVKINDLYAITDDIADRYSIYDATEDVELIAAMRDYLIGTVEGNVLGIKDLKNGTLIAKYANYQIENLGVEIYIPNYEENATGLYGKIYDDAENAKNVLWELAVYDNFVLYLKQAVASLDEAYKAYTSIKGLDTSRLYKLHVAYTLQSEKISLAEREALDDHAFEGLGKDYGYLAAYETLLKTIVSDDVKIKNHLEDICGTKFDTQLKEDALSYTADVAEYDQDTVYRLYQIVDDNGDLAYHYAGGAVRAFDQEVNKYATTKDGTRLY